MKRLSSAPTSRRHHVTVVALSLATALVAAIALSGAPASAAIADDPSISVTPSTVASGGSVVMTVVLPGSCGAFLPADVPLQAKPTGSSGGTWTGSVSVGYDVSTHGYQGSTTVPASTLLASNSTRGSWTATALLDDIICGDSLSPVSATFTIEPLATTTTSTTTAPTTTAWVPPTMPYVPYKAPPTTNVERTSMNITSGVVAEDANGRIEVRLTYECTRVWGEGTTLISSECLVRFRWVAIAGANGTFAPGTEVELWFFSDPVKAGTTTSNANGGFDASVQIPNIPDGEHTLVAKGTGPDGEPVAYEMPVRVVGGEAPGQLAFTGSTPRTPWFIAGGVLAILLGMALLVTTLRPEPVLVEMRTLRPIDPLRSDRRNLRRRRKV